MIAACARTDDPVSVGEEVQAARLRGLSVGFVPTMGALHGGHASLISRSAEENDLTVVSVFVNPRQFDEEGDLASYPRDEERDFNLAAKAGAGLCFFPEVGAIYPPGHVTRVAIRGPLTETLEGAGRGPEHFDGVCTVLSILFAITAPDVAYFGRKDAQQLRVVTKMVEDLRLPLRIEPVETERDASGLALSSRNVRLAGDDERRAALALSGSLAGVGSSLASGEIKDGEEASELGMGLLAAGGADPEYFAAVDAETFEPEASPGPSTLLLCAARVGAVRLIDNMTVREAAAFPATGGPRR